MGRLEFWIRLLGCLALLVVAACPRAVGPPDGLGPGLGTTDRPLGEFRRLRSIPWNATVLESWDLSDPAERSHWQVVGADRLLRGDREGLSLSSSGYRTELTREGVFEARSASVLRVVLEGHEKGQLVLEWIGRGSGSFGAERRLAVPASGHGEATFPLATHPGWTGTIDRLRLTVIAPDHRVVLLRTVALEQLEPPAPEVVEEALGPWRVDQDFEVRTAFVGLPETPLSWEMRVPGSATLKFGFAVDRDCQGPATLRVLFVPTRGDTETVDLFEERVEVDGALRGSWHDRVVDLSSVNHRQGTLRFAVAYPGAWEPGAGRVFWSQPEIDTPAAGDSGPNVVLISIDTLRRDHLSLYGYRRSTSPHLEELGRRGGLLFETTVAAASTTKISHASLFSGLDALSHGIQHGLVDDGLVLLPEVLRERGYSTAAITGGGRLHPSVGLDQGFDRYRYFQGDPVDELRGNTDSAITFLEQQAGKQRPFFLFFHTYETHSPYKQREPFYSQFGFEPAPGRLSVRAAAGPPQGEPASWRLELEPTEREPVIPSLSAQRLQQLAVERYDSSIAYADEQIGRILAALERLGELDETLVVVTSDHGEALGEGGRFGHGSLDDANLLVPLLVVHPRFGGELRRVRRQVRSIDVFPTILDFLGVVDLPAVDGRSLLSLIEPSAETDRREAWAYAGNTDHGLALRSGSQKYVFNDSGMFGEAQREAFFDLRTDPLELQNLVRRVETAAMRERALDRLDRELSGLRIRLENRTAVEATLSLRGVQLSRSRVSGWTCAPGTLQIPAGAGELTAALDPGTDCVLILDASSSASFEVRLTASGACSVAPDVESCVKVETWSHDRDASTTWSWSEDRWTKASEAHAGLRVAFSWQGRRVFGQDPVAMTPPLERQLRALGYVP